MSRIRYGGKPLAGENSAFLKRLQQAWEAAGATRVNVISGYRSPEYNRQIGGATGSNHTRGLAIDATVFIPGKGWIPAGEATNYARFGLRSGAAPSFFHGQPDPNHVDAGYMAQGVAPMGTQQGAPVTYKQEYPSDPFAQALSAASGGRIFPRVAAAWQRAEGGPASNPLNIGPGRTFSNPVAATEAFLTSQDKAGYYKPILAAQTPAAQIAAIKASPWDAGHYSNGVLDRTFAEQPGAKLGAPAPVASSSAARPQASPRQLPQAVKAALQILRA